MHTTADWAPTTADVGALLRARTKDENGNEVGDFTADTRPTGDQVEALIATASQDLADSLAVAVPEELFGAARRVSAYAVALEIELGYYPEQINTGRSPYAQLKAIYDERLLALRAALSASGGDVPGTDVDTPQSPVWAFPSAPVPSCEWGSVRLPGGNVVPVVDSTGQPLW